MDTKSDKKSYEIHSQTYNNRKLSILKQLQESKKRTAFVEKYMKELHDYFVAELRSLLRKNYQVLFPVMATA